MSESYKAAGVDVEAGYEAVRLMKEHVARTAVKGVLSGIGGFGGLFEIDTAQYKNLVLVSGTDGVGTKLKLAMLLDRHDTIGRDCVAMCVNDIVCSGAKPLFFLDYIAVGKNHPEKIASIVSGIADGCVDAGCALIGGETAEMPGFYGPDEYDLAGFSVGAVEKSRIIDGSALAEGDALIGLASSGIHSNGYSLVRKVFNIKESGEKLGEYFEVLGKTLGEELLVPTRIYVKPVLSLLERMEIKAISHITGGGFYENIPRMMQPGLQAEIARGSFDIPPIFQVLSSYGDIGEKDMFQTFNMGIGMVLAVAKDQADEAVAHLQARGEKAYIIGAVARGENGVVLC